MAGKDKGRAKPDAQCEHCTLADMIRAQHPNWDATTILWACLALAGDMISTAPGELRGSVMAQAIEVLGSRAGAKAVTDFQPVSVVH